MEKEKTTSEKIIDICQSTGKLIDLNTRFDRSNLTDNQQEQLFEILKQYFNIDKIEWTEEISGICTHVKKDCYCCKTYMINQEQPIEKENIFSGNVFSLDKEDEVTHTIGYLYSIQFSPELYSDTVDDNNYKSTDTIDYVKAVAYPAKKFTNSGEIHTEIRLRISKEKELDIDTLPNTNKYNLIQNAVTKVIDNPSYYYPEGSRHCLVRIALK
jgi:hypothetical protein